MRGKCLRIEGLEGRSEKVEPASRRKEACLRFWKGVPIIEGRGIASVGCRRWWQDSWTSKKTWFSQWGGYLGDLELDQPFTVDIFLFLLQTIEVRLNPFLSFLLEEDRVDTCTPPVLAGWSCCSCLSFLRLKPSPKPYLAVLLIKPPTYPL